MLRNFLLASILAAVSLPALAAPTFNLDWEHTQVSFSYDHLGFRILPVGSNRSRARLSWISPIGASRR